MQRKVVFWGKGSRAEEARELFPAWKIIAVVDNNTNYHGKMWHDVKIISFCDFLSLSNKPLLIVTPDKPEDILFQLREAGVERYLLMNELLFPEYRQTYQIMPSKRWADEKREILLEIYRNNWARESRLLVRMFFQLFLTGSSLGAQERILPLMRQARHPVTNSAYIKEQLEIICGKRVEICRYGSLPIDRKSVV